MTFHSDTPKHPLLDVPDEMPAGTVDNKRCATRIYRTHWEMVWMVLDRQCDVPVAAVPQLVQRRFGLRWPIKGTTVQQYVSRMCTMGALVRTGPGLVTDSRLIDENFDARRAELRAASALQRPWEDPEAAADADLQQLLS